MKIYRQGDVMLREVNAIPEHAKDVTPNDRIVLAYGEVTGRAHQIAPHEAHEFTMADAAGVVTRFLSVASEAHVRMLRVPPTTRTAREAVAWTFGLGADEYNPAFES